VLRQITSSTIGKAVTFSVFLKKKDRSYGAVFSRGGGVGTYVDLTTGVLGTKGGTTYLGSQVEAYPNGWWRVGVSFVDDGGGHSIYMANADGGATYQGDGTSGTYVFGAQVDLGTQMSPYRRVDATPYEKSLRNQVAQEQNLLSASNSFTTGWMYGTGGSVAAGVTDPNGGTTATAYTMASGSSAFAFLAQTISPITDAKKGYTFSVWMKSPSGTKTTVISISNLLVATLNSPTLTVTPAWQKFTFTVAPGALDTTSLGMGVGIQKGSFSTGDELDVWGAQLVQANYAGPYTPTTSQPFNEGNIRNVVAQQQNLITHSEQFDSGAWGLDSSGTGSNPTVSANYATAPNGTLAADRVQFNKGAGVGFSRIRQNATFVIGQVGTFSVWLKTNDGSTKTVGLRFDTVGTVVSVTPSWQRFSVTGATGSTVAAGQIVLWDVLNTSTSADLSVWGGQISQSYGPVEYVQTVTSIISLGGIPRIVVPQNQNLVLQSEAVSNAAWTKSNLSASGTTITDTVDGGGTQHYFYQSVTTGKGLPVTVSISAKAGTKSWLSFDVNSSFVAFFDLTNGVTGTVSAGYSAKIVPDASLGAGWYRCSITYTPVYALDSFVFAISNADGAGNVTYTGNGTGTILVNHAQIAITNYSSSYIPTTTAVVNIGNIRNVVAQKQNLLLQSQALATSPWSGIGGTTITNNADTAPDGTATATTVQDSSTGAFQGVGQTLSVGAGGVYTFSIYVKKTTGATASSGINFTSTGATATDGGSLSPRFNTNDGTGSTGLVSYPVGGYWRFRYRITLVAGQSLTIDFYPATGALPVGGGDSVTSVGTRSVWGAQLVQSNWSGPYVPTTVAAVNTGNIRSIAQ
jgi:hypothetical protein